MIPILHHISLNILIPKLLLNHKRSSTFPQFFNNSKRKRMLVTKSKNPMGRSKFSKSKSNTMELGFLFFHPTWLICILIVSCRWIKNIEIEPCLQKKPIDILIWWQRAIVMERMDTIYKINIYQKKKLVLVTL